MISLGSSEQFSEEKNYPFEHAGVKYLLINRKSEFFLIENHCGHFGVPLTEGKVKDRCINCPVHGISFDLTTGKIQNRPYEICDNILVVPLTISDGVLYYAPLHK